MPKKKQDETRDEMQETEIRIDEISLGWIYPKYFKRLVFYATELVGDEEKGRDVVTNVFVAIWEKREKYYFRNERLLKGFLYTTTKNKAIDIVRIDLKDRELMKGLGYFFTLEEAESEMDNALILTEAIAFIYEEIEKLTPQYQKVLRFSMQGLETEHIAKAMNITSASVRSNLARALKNIRKRIKEVGFFPA